MRTLIAAVLVGIAGHASADPITVLGLPLGGKLKTPIPKCKEMAARKFIEQGTCWIYTTGTSAGTQSGSLNVPGHDSRPAWAAYASIHADVAKDGTLPVFTVRTTYAEDAPKIIESISARFGRPTSFRPEPPVKWTADWERPELYVSLMCKNADGCFVRFVSAARRSTELKLIQERVKKDLARPVAP